MMLNDDLVSNPPLQRASARKWRVIEYTVVDETELDQKFEISKEYVNNLKKCS